MNERSPEGGVSPRQRAVMVLAILGFLLVAGIGTANHEMWRDEHHAWLIARDASSPVELIHNLRWDMNPPVWHLVLWGVTRLTHDPRAMQVVNLLFATIAAWLILRYAPFDVPLRILVVFGYFFAYEYAVISRVYALGTLFVVLVCVLWPRRYEVPVRIGVLLTLLANTVPYYGAAMAGFFVLLYALEIKTRPSVRKRALTAMAVASAGILLGIAQVVPRADNPFAIGKMTAALELDRIVRLARFIVSVVLPVPDASRYEYWNSNFLAGRFVSLDLVLSIACLLLLGFLLRRYRAPLVAWCVVVLAVAFAGYEGLFLSVRHGGLIHVMFVAAIWTGTLSRPTIERRTLERAVLVVLLATGVVGTAVALTMEINTEFTAVEATARFLQDEGHDREPIAGANDFVVASLASLLDLKGIYYPQQGDWGTYMRWSPKRRLHTTLAELGDDIARVVSETGRPMVVVLSIPPLQKGAFGDEIIRSAFLSDDVAIRLLAEFKESVVPDEKLWVYLAEPVK